jgi:hypothetical protein
MLLNKTVGNTYVCYVLWRVRIRAQGMGGVNYSQPKQMVRGKPSGYSTLIISVKIWHQCLGQNVDG